MTVHSEDIYIRTMYLNATKGHMIGEDSIRLEDSVFGPELKTGDLYRFGLHEYGRCAGKAYVDTDDGTKHIGYVFQGLDHYEDTGESYLREVWLTVDRKVTEAQPAEFADVALS